jgi:heat shock protein HslJ
MLLLSSCHKGGPPPALPVTRAPVPSWDQLRNATYQSVGEESTLTLRAGHWEGAPYLDGGAARPSADLLEGFRLVGDVDGDGVDDALVLIASRSGGTGENTYLALVQTKAGAPVNTSTALVGDRIQIRRGMLEGRRIVLEAVQAGPSDALCCPGELVSRSWQVVSGTLQESATPDSTARLTLDAIEGEWVLRKWTRDELAPGEPRVTLRVADGVLNGRAACNGYSSRPRAGDMPGVFTVGPVVSTRVACPDSVMKIETRYFDLLGRVRQFGFIAGRLVLSYEKDSLDAAMIFDRVAPRDTSRTAPPR